MGVENDSSNSNKSNSCLEESRAAGNKNKIFEFLFYSSFCETALSQACDSTCSLY